MEDERTAERGSVSPMDILRSILRRKPFFFIISASVYIVGTALLKWVRVPSWDILWYGIGGFLGLFFLDAAEQFFQLTPSPFRSMLFAGLFAIVSLFVVTSSGSAIALGLVLSLDLELVLRQLGEWKMTGSVSSWYRNFPEAVPVGVQRVVTLLFIGLFLLETVMVTRS